ncbi:F-box/FBD/LRR-repeat protein At1g13570-like isoform X1 [Hordeum vulgare subsp. vulgare]|uniref:F-box domain-containing protein n=1 Tax=Hordeum vulgare subsp. vulgare TaxID=112509 RepID=A0A8I6XAD6_HORVV|nr:F-box/FBD/LRR-repeat protein At1g13570-like isoform X1 [Hordeum vulgare subsp. vulgare]
MDSEAMSTCEKARVEPTSVVSADRLSSLPTEIKGKILSRLKVEEAVRTSILSTTWRDAWANMPGIYLHEGNFARTKFIMLVDMVLALYKGTIEQFGILSGKRSYHDEFARWMLMLSRRSPRSVIIELNSGPRYRIPSCLFSIDGLMSLRLKNCIISLPRVFQGFKRLTVLFLKRFSSTDRDIQNLLSFCPELTNLRSSSFEGINCLNIQAPKLESLHVDGDFEEINLDASNLHEAILSTPKAKSYQSVSVAHDKEGYVKLPLGSLSEIKTLAIFGFMKYLSKGCILMKPPAVFTRLENFYLAICFWDQRQVLTACSLLQNAPNLKKLHIRSDPLSTRDQDQVSIQGLTLELQMDHLITASMIFFKGLDYEVDFLAKLLSCTPALEEVKIEWMGEMDRSMVLTKLLALPRVSPRAKIIVT